MNDSIISVVDSTVAYACLAIAAPLIPFYLRVITALPRSKSTANAVYMIYQVGGIIDIFSLFNTILQMLSQQGLLPEPLLVDETARMIMALIYSTRIGQLCTVFLISLNRVIAVRLPTRYHRVFGSRWTIPSLVTVQFTPSVFYFGYFVLTSDSTWTTFGSGRTVSASFHITRLLDVSCIAIQLFFTLSNTIFYCIIIISLKKKIQILDTREMKLQTDTRKTKQERNFSKMAVIVCSFDFLYLAYMVLLAVCDVPKAIQLTLFNLLSIVVGGAAPCLLFAFSSTVRANLAFSWRRNAVKNSRMGDSRDTTSAKY